MLTPRSQSASRSPARPETLGYRLRDVRVELYGERIDRS